MNDATIGAIFGLIGAGITAFITLRTNRRQVASEIEKAQISERETIREFMSGQLREMREDHDKLRIRVRITEEELLECTRNHLKAEMAMVKAGIKVE